ncbi:MAG TPA: hypothetical protein DCE23_03415 [Firmicutes bacterium]|nr:hypothetical protein [Bacillota bacterium]
MAKENNTKTSTKKTAKKVTKTSSDIKKINTSNEETKALEVIDVICVEEQKPKTKKKNNTTYQLFKHFATRLKEDKLYFFSFIVTIVSLLIFSLTTLKDTEGYYDRKNSNIDSTVTVPADPTLKNPAADETPAKSDDIDVSDYVGIYSREVTLSEPLKLGTCEVRSYKYVYKIKEDKTITKYLMNDCIGTIKIWSDKLTYISTGGARYISANKINFLFSASSMKEVDAETYKIDEDIDLIKENNKIPNLETYFYSNSIILNTGKDLILIKGNTIFYQLSKKYNTDIKILDKTVYKSSKDNLFRFIAYDNKDELSRCYDETDLNDIDKKDLYKIYSIKYNEEDISFDKEKEIVSRSTTDGCQTLNEDLASLSE